jgi:hypothetical protein
MHAWAKIVYGIRDRSCSSTDAAITRYRPTPAKERIERHYLCPRHPRVDDFLESPQSIAPR